MIYLWRLIFAYRSNGKYRETEGVAFDWPIRNPKKNGARQAQNLIRTLKERQRECGSAPEMQTKVMSVTEEGSRVGSKIPIVFVPFKFTQLSSSHRHTLSF